MGGGGGFRDNPAGICDGRAVSGVPCGCHVPSLDEGVQHPKPKP